MRKCLPLLALALAACSTRETRTPKHMLELRFEGAVLQKHEYSCGAAALATMMGYFGSPASEESVLKAVFGDKLPEVRMPDGRRVLRALTLEDLEIGARKMGFKVVSARVPEAAGLEESLHALKPAIARMSLYGEYLHFVVVRDIAGDWVSISDPAYGNYRMPKSQFFASWEGGDRVLLAIGREPFEAWKTREDRLFLRRPDAGRLPPGDEVAALPLYRAVHQRTSQLTALPR